MRHAPASTMRKAEEKRRADEWFRNHDWTPATEAKFFEKLRRARHKSQYLRIQAGYLTQSHPQAALALLERYFALGEGIDLAQAYVEQAKAYISLEQMEDAIGALEKALHRERQFPNCKTHAWSEFALLVATKNLVAYFPTALRVLSQHRLQLLFPVEKFMWHAANALITAAQGDLSIAKEHAVKALDAANAKDSGLRYHRELALVSSGYEAVRRKLLQLSKCP